MAEQTGFGVFLNLPALRLNLKASAMIMNRVNVHYWNIILDTDRVLPFCPEDVKKIFDIPMGGTDVSDAVAQSNEVTREFLRRCKPVSDKGAHSLKAAESILDQPLSEESSQTDKYCFQIAYVMYIMGHCLAPSTKNDYANTDFWAAISDPKRIKEFNWCEYVLRTAVFGAGKLKRDVQSGSATSHLTGCHLFFQVFLLDNLSIGGIIKDHLELPRIKYFDADTTKSMIDFACSSDDAYYTLYDLEILPADQVCYSRVTADHQPKRTIRNCAIQEDDSSSGVRVKTQGFRTPEPTIRMHNPQQGIQLKTPETTMCPLNLGHIVPPQSGLLPRASPSSLRPGGQNELAKHILTNFPSVAQHPIAIMLKHHNALLFSKIISMRCEAHEEIMAFSDKILCALERAVAHKSSPEDVADDNFNKSS